MTDPKTAAQHNALLGSTAGAYYFAPKPVPPPKVKRIDPKPKRKAKP